MLKKEVRIIAWDDCAFSYSQKNVRIVGVIFRGGDFIDGMLSSVIRKDGTDVTEKIGSAILASRHYDQLSYVMTNGISFAGLNILDINELHRRTKLPVIAVVRKKPDRRRFIAALKKFPDFRKRASVVRRTGHVAAFGEIFFQKAGISLADCRELLKLTCTRSKIPEPLRVAHLVASGLSGESRGRA